MALSKKASGTVLIVDDDQAVGKVIKAILVSDGYSVVTASDGLEALNILEDRKGSVRLVITDVTMPNMDGLELTTRLQTTHPVLPILLVSGFVPRGIRDLLGERVTFLEKPFTVNALLGMVRAALERSSGWLTRAESPS